MLALGHVDQDQAAARAEHSPELRQHRGEVGLGQQVEHVVVHQQVEAALGELQVVGVANGQLGAQAVACDAPPRPLGHVRNFVGQHFWPRGYFVTTVGRDEAAVREYIREQEREDLRTEKLNLQ
jgi:putative transposase